MVEQQPPRRIQFPGGPPPDAPVPNDPIEGVDLATYARIAADLAEGNTPRLAILRACGLDEAAWLRIEQGHLIRIATAALREDTSRVEELDRLYIAAQDALGPTDPSRPLDRYAWLVGRIERGEDPAVVARSEGLSLPDWARLQRAWTRRLADDPALATTFRQWVVESKG